MSSLRRFAPPALGAALLLLSGCGAKLPPYDGPRAPEYFNACALFPASEAKAELRGLEIGQVSGPLDASSGKKFARCAYGYGPEAIVVASLELRRHEHPDEIRRGMEASLDLLNRLTKNDVSVVEGIGDRAIWAGGELRLLKVGWRDLEILVTVAPGHEAGFHRPVAERIARRAILRLEELPLTDDLLLTPREVQLSGAAAPLMATPSEPAAH